MNERARLVGVVVAVGVGLLVAGCAALSRFTSEGESSASQSPDKKETGARSPDVDVGFLLSMSFTEAQAISPQNLAVPPFYKIAADDIKVLSKDDQGVPRRVRAKGHVFLQIEFREEIRALGQEALVDEDEVILRGKPLMKRGRSVVEGLEDTTVFFIQGTKLHALGQHRVTTQEGVTPTWQSNWREGPNPLLPALSPNDVPKEIRVSPLLPPPGDMDKPKL